MFHSASFKLTFGYLAIIMTLSLLFSALLFRVSTEEFNRDLHRFSTLQQAPFFAPRGFSALNELRITQIQESKNHLRLQFIYFNLAILMCGGTASYFLAERTLRPIEEALIAQHRFTTDASHELRTPLTAMKTELEVGLRDTNMTLAESKTLLKSVLDEVNKLDSLSAGLLTLARNGSHPLKKEHTPFKTIASQAMQNVTSVATIKHIALILQHEERTIFGDQVRLTELVTILLENAVKYSSKNKTIWLNAEHHNEKTIITIKDEGSGIPHKDLPHIFDRFYRADTSRSKQKANGYGLGLSIAKQIIESHNGTIEVESNPDIGTTFTIILPAT